MSFLLDEMTARAVMNDRLETAQARRAVTIARAGTGRRRSWIAIRVAMGSRLVSLGRRLAAAPEVSPAWPLWSRAHVGTPEARDAPSVSRRLVVGMIRRSR